MIDNQIVAFSRFLTIKITNYLIINRRGKIVFDFLQKNQKLTELLIKWLRCKILNFLNNFPSTLNFYELVQLPTATLFALIIVNKNECLRFVFRQERAGVTDRFFVAVCSTRKASTVLLLIGAH